MSNEISFEMISKGGEAFSLLVDALRDARHQDWEGVNRKKAEAERIMNEAHNLQTQLIVEEMNGADNQPNVLLIHAQDTLMNTILMFTLLDEFIYIYQKGEK
ncbi:TPA: PTS lactose/cellobiose transporter subunit IIA [Streptococcus suis]|nr:PTS lactose/cellobiose transporter subunit IIA [Streptococcus suis]HEM3649034.1 PTS lactose/cellobiose transporter subunit IIA [Streptococcus suis]